MLNTLNKVPLFHEFIAQRREILGLSQRDLAKRVGITHAVISRLENGQADDFKFSTFLGLASALQVHPMDLIRLYERAKGSLLDSPSTARLPSDDDEAFLAVCRAYLTPSAGPA